MKKRFYSIAKKYKVEIVEYESKRSDMGVQMFDLKIKYPNGIIKKHDDGYFVGEDQGREKVLNYFQETLDRFLTPNPK